MLAGLLKEKTYIYRADSNKCCWHVFTLLRIQENDWFGLLKILLLLPKWTLFWC